MTTTESGQFRIYHVSNAGAPDVHDTTDGEWFYEPVDWGVGDVYSEGHPTEADALAAAERWEVQREIEEQIEADEIARYEQ